MMKENKCIECVNFEKVSGDEFGWCNFFGEGSGYCKACTCFHERFLEPITSEMIIGREKVIETIASEIFY